MPTHWYWRQRSAYSQEHRAWQRERDRVAWQARQQWRQDPRGPEPAYIERTLHEWTREHPEPQPPA